MYKVRVSEFPRYFDAVGRVTGVHTARKKSCTAAMPVGFLIFLSERTMGDPT